MATFQGHTDRVYSAVFSADGRRVLTASHDNTARLWEAESGQLLATFQGHTSPVQSAVFSPDSRHVLTTSWDKTSRLWPVLPAGVPPPDWCGDFLVWLGGKRIAPDGEIETLSGQELQDLDARLRPHMNEDTDYARLLRWRLLAPEQRPFNPYGIATQAEAADLIIRPDMNEYEAQHAYDLDPWHPLVHLALAGFEKDPIRADFLRRYSLDRLPNDPKLRQRAAEFLRKQEKENLAQEAETLIAQGKFAEALDAYQQDLEIAKRLVEQDKPNTDWQRNLSVSYERVGNVLKAQGKLQDALGAYQQDLAIAKRLAAQDKSNSGWQRDLIVSLYKVGMVTAKIGGNDNIEEARRLFRTALGLALMYIGPDREELTNVLSQSLQNLVHSD